jgi:hypothetical protein
MIATLIVVGGRLETATAMEMDGSSHVSNLNLARLQAGTVTVLGPTACPPDAAATATCRSIRVTCTGLPDLDATLARSGPTANPNGTIIMLNGGPGTSLLNKGFADVYAADGFQVIQLAWASDWADAQGAGVKSAACRPASVFQFVFNTMHQRSRTRGFCGQGISGGGAALAYSLAHYGMSNLFDYVVIAAGPGVSRMDYGCDPSLYTGPPRNLCPLLPNAMYSYAGGQLWNGWENTTTCAAANPLPSDIDRWTADSIVSAGANYSYPNTGMSWFFCATPPASGGSTGQSTFLIDNVNPKNTPPDVNCYSGSCKEDVWSDPNAFNATLSEMLAQCTPKSPGSAGSRRL